MKIKMDEYKKIVGFSMDCARIPVLREYKFF